VAINSQQTTINQLFVESWKLTVAKAWWL